ncbi:hypothetical protein ACLOJK_037075 [Asimina triloba]
MNVRLASSAIPTVQDSIGRSKQGSSGLCDPRRMGRCKSGAINQHHTSDFSIHGSSHLNLATFIIMAQWPAPNRAISIQKQRAAIKNYKSVQGVKAASKANPHPTPAARRTIVDEMQQRLQTSSKHMTSGSDLHLCTFGQPSLIHHHSVTTSRQPWSPRSDRQAARGTPQHLPPDPADGEYNSHARTAVGHHSDHQFSSGRKTKSASIQTESASIQTEIRQMRQRTHPNGHSSSKIIQPNTQAAAHPNCRGQFEI